MGSSPHEELVIELMNPLLNEEELDRLWLGTYEASLNPVIAVYLDPCDQHHRHL